MKCPKCGYHRQERDSAFTPATECPACGIVYAKHEQMNATPATIGAAPPSHLKPSPVDAISLKKARERVEKRLRKQLEIKVKDQRHEQTLKLARRFATQEVLRRQETWEKNQEETADPPAPGDESAPVIPPGSHARLNGKPEMNGDVRTETIILESESITSKNRSEPAGRQTSKDAVTFEEKPIDLAAPVPGRGRANRSGQGLMRFLPSVAWLILCCGVVGAFLSWTTISSVEAGVNIPVPDELSTLPLGLLLGFAYLATGALGFAFFWVSSLISKQLSDIRRLLLLQPAPVRSGGASPGAPSETIEDA